MSDTYQPLSPEVSARQGLPLMLEKIRRTTTDADHHRAALATLGLQIETLAESLGIQPTRGRPCISIEVEISDSDAGSVSYLHHADAAGAPRQELWTTAFRPYSRPGWKQPASRLSWRCLWRNDHPSEGKTS